MQGGTGRRISINPRIAYFGRKIAWASKDKARFTRFVGCLSQITQNLNEITSAGDHVRQIQYDGTNDTSPPSTLRVLLEGKIYIYIYIQIYIQLTQLSHTEKRKMYQDFIGGASMIDQQNEIDYILSIRASAGQGLIK